MSINSRMEIKWINTLDSHIKMLCRNENDLYHVTTMGMNFIAQTTERVHWMIKFVWYAQTCTMYFKIVVLDISEFEILSVYFQINYY